LSSDPELPELESVFELRGEAVTKEEEDDEIGADLLAAVMVIL